MTDGVYGGSRSSPTWVVSSWRRRRRRPLVFGGRHSRCPTEHTCTPVRLSLAFSPFSFWLQDEFSFFSCSFVFPAGLSASASKSPSHSSSGLTRVSAYVSSYSFIYSFNVVILPNYVPCVAALLPLEFEYMWMCEWEASCVNVIAVHL